MKKIIDMASMHFNYEVIAILTTIDIIGKNLQVEIKKTQRLYRCRGDSNPFTSV